MVSSAVSASAPLHPQSVLLCPSSPPLGGGFQFPAASVHSPPSSLGPNFAHDRRSTFATRGLGEIGDALVRLYFPVATELWVFCSPSRVQLDRVGGFCLDWDTKDVIVVLVAALGRACFWIVGNSTAVNNRVTYFLAFLHRTDKHCELSSEKVLWFKFPG